MGPSAEDDRVALRDDQHGPREKMQVDVLADVAYQRVREGIDLALGSLVQQLEHPGLVMVIGLPGYDVQDLFVPDGQVQPPPQGFSSPSSAATELPGDGDHPWRPGGGCLHPPHRLVLKGGY